jgi:DNA-directed RNA polymerase subunit beta'
MCRFSGYRIEIQCVSVRFTSVAEWIAEAKRVPKVEGFSNLRARNRNWLSTDALVNVQDGDRVRAGEPLMDGPRNPHDILAVLGEKELHAYLVNEIQEVYRVQGVGINDKHIEVIVRQMMRWVKVEEVGGTEFPRASGVGRRGPRKRRALGGVQGTPPSKHEEQVDKFRFQEENERVLQDGGLPAKGRPLLLGITKASLSTDSFISAASFQAGVPNVRTLHVGVEVTSRVLTEASISGKVESSRFLTSALPL